MKNTTPGFHIEFPMIHNTVGEARKLTSSKEIEGFELTNRRTLEYKDTYWDTERGDLYSSSRILRTRTKHKNIDFLDYKGVPQYLFQSLFARPLYSESINSDQEAIDALKLNRPSEPIQALFKDRFDLLGNKLVKVADCLVNRVNFDLCHKNSREFLCTLSIHDYYFKYDEITSERHELIEIQPFSNPAISSELPLVFSLAKEILVKRGWKLSPTSKYHRIDRSILDRA